MKYSLAEKLRDKGFPIESCDYWTCPHPEERNRQFVQMPDGYFQLNSALEPHDCDEEIHFPSLSSLIDELGKGLYALVREGYEWRAFEKYDGTFQVGDTPDEAAACLWLHLNK